MVQLPYKISGLMSDHLHILDLILRIRRRNHAPNAIHWILAAAFAIVLPPAAYVAIAVKPSAVIDLIFVLKTVS